MNKIARPETGDDSSDTPSAREDESAPRSFGERHPDTPPPASGGWLGTGWKILRSPLGNLIGPVITLLFAFIAFAIIRETFRDVVVIQPIGVPTTLANEGYGSGIIAQRLVDQITQINWQNEIAGRPFLKKGRSFDTDLRQVDVELPGLGLSLRAALSYLRSTFGAGETQVSGEIVREEDQHLVLRLRVGGEEGTFFDIRSSEEASVPSGSATGASGAGANSPSPGLSALDDILKSGAIQTMRALDSYALAVYYLDKEKEKVPEIVQYCEDHDPDCKPWAALMRGLVFADRQDWTAAAASYQQALDEFRFPGNGWPAYGMAYVNLAEILRSRSARDDRQANAQDHAKAMGMYHQAIWLFEYHGLSVDPYDQFYVGHIYQMGYSVGAYNRPDCGEAERWYRRAAERGNALAQNSLGDLYNPGIDKGGCDGLPAQSLEEARDWYGQAAEGGQVYAQRRLGEMYKAGNGLSGGKDPELATYYLRKAADRGDVIALTDLGEIYQDGIDGTPDWIRAYAWLALAADAQGETSAVGKASDERDKAAGYLTGNELAKAISLAHEWKLGHRGGL